MNVSLLAERAVLAFAGAAAVFGLVGGLVLAAGGAVPTALLGIAALAGIAVASTRRSAPGERRAPRWRQGLVSVLAGGGAALVAVDAMATPARHWDGAVAWQAKTRALAAAPTLAQPFFADPSVYSHSRDYPLLQPLAMALAERAGVDGRWLFPLAYLVVVGAVLAAGSRAARGGEARSLACTAAVAVTPMFLSSAGGSFASGYGDGVLTALVAATALGLAIADRRLVAAGIVAMALQKPEGIVYGAALVAACWSVGTAPLLRAAVGALALGATVELVLQRALVSGGIGSQLLPSLAIASGAAILAGITLFADRLARRRSLGPIARTALLAAIGAFACAALACGGTGALAAHLAPERALERLARLPQIVAGLVANAVFGGRFGLTFVAAPMALALARRHRTASHGPLLAWLALAVPVVCLPFLLSPIDDLDQHLKATLPRLLMHWTGAAWLWTAAVWSATGSAAPHLGGATEAQDRGLA